MSGPLDGVRVVDMTMNIMGPYASQILGDMGADVRKVEPLEGDTSRGIGPSRSPKMGPLFLALNRNKRSIALDVKSARGSAVMKRLLEHSDVLLYSLRPQSMLRMGLSYEAVSSINSRVIYCGAFGFGQRGPYADKPAYEDIIQSLAGVTFLQAAPGGEPRFVVPTIVDRSMGIAIAGSIGMALYRRERTGHGQAIEIPMFEWMTQYILGDHLWGHSFDPPLGDFGYPRTLNVHRKPYKTKDGYVSVMMYTGRHWTSFFEIVGRPELAHDPRYATITARTENIETLYAFVAETLATRTTAEWLDVLTAGDLPVCKVNAPADVLADPHLQALNFFPIVDHPSEGKLRTMGIPTTWSESQPDVRHLPPLLGQHTGELLSEIGYESSDIAEFIRDGVAYDARSE